MTPATIIRALRRACLPVPPYIGETSNADIDSRKD